MWHGWIFLIMYTKEWILIQNSTVIKTNVVAIFWRPSWIFGGHFPKWPLKSHYIYHISASKHHKCTVWVSIPTCKGHRTLTAILHKRVLRAFSNIRATLLTAALSGGEKVNQHSLTKVQFAAEISRWHKPAVRCALRRCVALNLCFHHGRNFRISFHTSVALTLKYCNIYFNGNMPFSMTEKSFRAERRFSWNIKLWMFIS